MRLDRNAFSGVFMIPLSSAVSSGYTYKSKFGGYEITFDGDCVGWVRREKASSCTFVASTPKGDLIFRRSGFLGAGTEILDPGSRQTIAVFKSAWGGKGNLTFSDGQVFHLECKGMWRPIWTFATQSGQPVVRLRTREKTVDVMKEKSLTDERLALLMLFVLYRVRQAEDDAASAAVVSMIAAS